MTQLAFQPGEVIFRQGYPSDNAYIIESGVVEIYKENPGGSEEHIADLSAGQMFGEYGVLDDAPRSASARAKTKVQLQIMSL